MIKYLLYLILILWITQIYKLNTTNNILYALVSIILGLILINWLFTNTSFEKFSNVNIFANDCVDGNLVNCPSGFSCNYNINPSQPDKYWCNINQEISLLTIDQINSILDNNPNALNQSQINELDSLQIGGLSIVKLNLIFKYLSAEQISFLNIIEHIPYLSLKQINSLTTSQIQALTTSQIQSLTVSQIQTLDPSQIQALTIPQINALSLNITNLTNLQISELSPSQISALSPSQLQTIVDFNKKTDPSNVITFSSSQLNALSELQLDVYNNKL